MSASSFGIDLRSLALLRILLGALLLADLLLRAQSLGAHYTDQGVLPRAAQIIVYESYEENSPASYWWSLHMASGQRWFQAALFVLAAIAAVCLLAGFRTRMATLASWILLVSLHARCPEVLAGGDAMLRLLLFWCLFLPLGARFSIDALRAQRLEISLPGKRYLSVASAALLLQVALVYWVNAAVKTGPPWTSELTAVYYALNLDLYATRFGQQLLAYPHLMKWLTAATRYWEIIGPAIALCPWANKWCRASAIAGFMLFHVGLAACFHLGIFPFVAIAAWTVFLPSEFWEAARRRSPALRRRAAAVAQSVTTCAGRWIEYAAASPARPTAWTQCIAAAALIYILGLNLHTVYQSVAAPRDREVAAQAEWWEIPKYLLSLDQPWRMFAPQPATDDGWFVFRGVLRSGEQVNLWRPNRPLPLAKPRQVSDQFPNHRWRKYLVNARWSDNEDLLSLLSDWLQRRWNRQYSRHDAGREVATVEIFFQSEPTPRPGQPVAPPHTQLLFRGDYATPSAGNNGQEQSRPAESPPPPFPPDEPPSL